MGEWGAQTNDKEALYRNLNQDDLIGLEKIFKSAKEEKFTIHEFDDVLQQYDIHFTSQQLDSLFQKVRFEILR